MAALTAFFVVALMLNAWTNLGSWSSFYVGGGIPMNARLMKGYRYCLHFLDESREIGWSWHSSLLANRPSARPLPFKHFGLSWPSELRSSKFLLWRSELTVAADLQNLISDQNQNRLCSRCYLIAVPICILFFFLQRTLFQASTLVR